MRLIAFIVALALVPAIAIAAVPKNGSWSGDTRQGESVSFAVKNGKVKNLKVNWNAKCGGMEVDGKSTFGGKFDASGGKFRADASNGYVKGNFPSKKRAEGTLRFKPRIFTGTGYVTCDTGKIHWTAKR
jgi:hypothetical protein